MHKYILSVLGVILGATIYLNDGSYIWVYNYSDWNMDSKTWGQWIVRIPIGIKYTADGKTHYIPYSAIKEIVK